jgi:hypothetical protein
LLQDTVIVEEAGFGKILISVLSFSEITRKDVVEDSNLQKVRESFT